MTKEEWNQTVATIDRAFAALAGVPSVGTSAALTASLVDGKLYELRVLAWLLSELTDCGLKARMVNGPRLLLRKKPGVVDRRASYLTLIDASAKPLYEVWCNVQFLGLGAGFARRTSTLAPDFHELDIAVIQANISAGLIPHTQVLIGVECKDRILEKRMLREMLGLRRELSIMSNTISPPYPLAHFSKITRQEPPIRLFLCSSNRLPRDFQHIADVHAIHVVHIPI